MVSEVLDDENKNDESTNKPKKTNWHLYFCAFAANLLTIACGFVLALTSPIVGKLTSNNTDINPFLNPITKTDISLLAYLPSVAACLGYFITPEIVDAIGRKKALLVSSIGLAVSLTSLAFARGIYGYLICFFVNGFCESISFVTVPVYLAEVCLDKYAGKINFFTGISLPIGIAIGYNSGSVTSISTLSLIGSIFPWMFIFLSQYLPESTFLNLKTTKEDSLKSFETLNGIKNMNSEYEKVNTENEEPNLKDSDKSVKKIILDILKNPIHIRAFLLSKEF